MMLVVTILWYMLSDQAVTSSRQDSWVPWCLGSRFVTLQTEAVLDDKAIADDLYLSPFFRAEAIYQSMKSTYGLSACHLLQINSRSKNAPENVKNDHTNMPDPWSQFLNKKPEYNVRPERFKAYKFLGISLSTPVMGWFWLPVNNPDLAWPWIWLLFCKPCLCFIVQSFPTRRQSLTLMCQSLMMLNLWLLESVRDLEAFCLVLASSRPWKLLKVPGDQTICSQFSLCQIFDRILQLPVKTELAAKWPWHFLFVSIQKQSCSHRVPPSSLTTPWPQRLPLPQQCPLVVMWTISSHVITRTTASL